VHQNEERVHLSAPYVAAVNFIKITPVENQSALRVVA
ncbi:unnamed protein product, partial [marine sediment metagenome]